MSREREQVAVYCLQAVERRFSAQRGAGGFYGIGAVHAYKSVQILQRLALLFLAQQQQGLQAAVVISALGAKD